MMRIVAGVVGLALVLTVAIGAFYWFVCRVEVGPDECLVVVRKTGDPLPAGQTIADQAGQKGIQREALGPGRYFFLPWTVELKREPLTLISAGDPDSWREVYAAGNPEYQNPELKGEWPEAGIVTAIFGKEWTGESEVVPAGYRGLQRTVLTPGEYRLNPYAYKVERVPATVVPIGCVGVVISLLGEDPGTEIITESSIGPDGEIIQGPEKFVQRLAEEGQRGVMKDVLPPGLYYLNPKVHRVEIVQIGYNELSQVNPETVEDEITFPASDGFTIAIEVTVVWGRDPQHTPEMINRFGELSRIKEIILGQTRSICRNIGSEYVSTDFIEGEKREQYQAAVTETLRRVSNERNIEILIALIQNIEVRGGTDSGEGLDLKQTIQRGYIAREEELTTQKKQETATVKATLATAQIEIEVARENIVSETRKKVAKILAEGQKEAEQIDAQRDLEVAQIDRQVAELEAQRRLVLGRAEAEVEELCNQAEADGKRLFVEAFGSGRAYNLYTFATHFNPGQVSLIFAGDGTFWTDLQNAQELGAMQILSDSQQPQPAKK
jgi:hypothetical protein